MSREIKFRAWNTVTEKMMLWDDIKRFGNLNKLISLNHVHVQQFTGMVDKNGKEIYEGDWLRICAGYSSKVEFQDGMFVSVYDHWEDHETIPLIDAIGKETEVIGNIHQENIIS